MEIKKSLKPANEKFACIGVKTELACSGFKKKLLNESF